MPPYSHIVFGVTMLWVATTHPERSEESGVGGAYDMRPSRQWNARTAPDPSAAASG